MKILESISRIGVIIGSGVIGVMMMWTVVDVFLRYVFGAPVPGTMELTELMMVVAGFMAIAWCAVKREHIKVDFIMTRFSPRIQAITDSITYALGLAASVIITWRGFSEALVVLQAGRITSVLRVPDFPFHCVLVAGFGVFCLVLASYLIQSVAKVIRG